MIEHTQEKWAGRTEQPDPSRHTDVARTEGDAPAGFDQPAPRNKGGRPKGSKDKKKRKLRSDRRLPKDRVKAKNIDQANWRAKKRAQGLVPVEVFVPAANVDTFKAAAAQFVDRWKRLNPHLFAEE